MNLLKKQRVSGRVDDDHSDCHNNGCGFFNRFNFDFRVGPILFEHWLAWIGTLFVASYIPAYHILKRRYPRKTKLLLNIHVFGTLIAFMFVSIHTMEYMFVEGRLSTKLGTGLALYLAMIFLVSTGFAHRFKLLRMNK